METPTQGQNASRMAQWYQVITSAAWRDGQANISPLEELTQDAFASQGKELAPNYFAQLPEQDSFRYALAAWGSQGEAGYEDPLGVGIVHRLVTDDGTSFWYVDKLAVSKKHRNNGVGKSLIEFSLDFSTKDAADMPVALRTADADVSAYYSRVGQKLGAQLGADHHLTQLEGVYDVHIFGKDPLGQKRDGVVRSVLAMPSTVYPTGMQESA